MYMYVRTIGTVYIVHKRVRRVNSIAYLSYSMHKGRIIMHCLMVLLGHSECTLYVRNNYWNNGLNNCQAP